MSKIVVVFHSGYGHTRRVAEKVAEAAEAELLEIDENGELPDSGWEKLQGANCIIMGSPTYMGTVSWQFKKFADATSKAWMAQMWKDKFFAGFTNSGSVNGDKHSTLHYFITLAMQHSGLWIGAGIMPSNRKDAERNDVNYLGSFAGLMTQSPTDGGVDDMYPGDLETAAAFGKRVAAVVRR